LKEIDMKKSSRVKAISGKKFCGFLIDWSKCSAKSRDFMCDGHFCDASLSLTDEKFCSTQFNVQVLEGDYGQSREYLDVYINGVSRGKCDPGTEIWGSGSPSWHDCGIFRSSADSFKIKLQSTKSDGGGGVHKAGNTYNGEHYTVYGRLGYKAYDVLDKADALLDKDLFSIARICPNASVINDIDNCGDVACGVCYR
jgi:hypothetical protein